MVVFFDVFPILQQFWHGVNAAFAYKLAGLSIAIYDIIILSWLLMLLLRGYSLGLFFDDVVAVCNGFFVELLRGGGGCGLG